jgi:uncharacterized protein YfaP (DUF2135 family)
VAELSQNDKLTSLTRDYGLSMHTPMQVDLRIILNWNIDMTDLELHVYEPGDEHCHSFHNHTRNGGLLSSDMVRGYGPEEYLVLIVLSFVNHK